MLFTLASVICPRADEVQAAYLENRAASTILSSADRERADQEEAQARYHVTWKQPVAASRGLPLEPIFPAACLQQNTAAPEITTAVVM